LLVEHSAALDASLLGPAIPFDLIDAGDPRMRRCAEGLFKHNLFSGDSSLLTLWAADPNRPSVDSTSSEAHALDLSSLASLWMARYLIRLGRETGEGRHLIVAVAMLDGILARLGRSGWRSGPQPRSGDFPRFSPSSASGVWELHAMLIETTLDLGGIDYRAPSRTLHVRPALPGSWPSIGLGLKIPGGDVSYRLDRPVGGTVHRLGLDAQARSTDPRRGQPDLPRPGRPRPLGGRPPLSSPFDRKGDRAAPLVRSNFPRATRPALDLGVIRHDGPSDPESLASRTQRGGSERNAPISRSTSSGLGLFGNQVPAPAPGGRRPVRGRGRTGDGTRTVGIMEESGRAVPLGVRREVVGMGDLEVSRATALAVRDLDGDGLAGELVRPAQPA
jgi:hypothetical protein